MTRKFNTSDAAFKTQFADYLSEATTDSDMDLAKSVSAILHQVKLEGNDAVIRYTQQFDDPEFDVNKLIVSKEEIAAAKKECDPELLATLKRAATRISDYHERQKPKEHEEFADRIGTTLGWRWTPLDSVGLYVPGGLASYFSTVLMNAIPAKIAGVQRVVMVTPAPKGKLNPYVLAAAEIAGVSEIYRIGGAQAVGALAYGTDAIKPVKKIVGPGNAYVAEAKRQVFGLVGIDTIAGPSEILVIADKSANPKWVAADLLSQAEHDKLARSILVTADEALAEAITKEVEIILKDLPKKDIATESWTKRSAVIVTKDLDEAIEVSNQVAPEHMELAIEKPRKYLHNVRNAGAIFMGHYTPEAMGDYIAGPSHVLPTAGAAAFSSGLSVLDFMKRSSLIDCAPEAFSLLADDTANMAEAEGLAAHALSVTIRKN